MAFDTERVSLTLDEIWNILSKLNKKDIVTIEFDIKNPTENKNKIENKAEKELEKPEKIYSLCGKHDFVVYDINFNILTNERQSIYLVDNDELRFYIGKRPFNIFASLIVSNDHGFYMDWIITEKGQYEGRLSDAGVIGSRQLLILAIMPKIE